MPREDEIRARLAKATPGPWKCLYDDLVVPVSHPRKRLVCKTWNTEDVVFIANAPSDIDYLLKENQRLREALNVRAPVRWFAGQMEAKLLENDHKGGWSTCEPSWLRMRLEEELHELHREMVRLEIGRSTPEQVIGEAADVANFAMMIADNIRPALQPKDSDE